MFDNLCHIHMVITAVSQGKILSNMMMNAVEKRDITSRSQVDTVSFTSKRVRDSGELIPSK